MMKKYLLNWQFKKSLITHSITKGIGGQHSNTNSETQTGTTSMKAI